MEEEEIHMEENEEDVKVHMGEIMIAEPILMAETKKEEEVIAEVDHQSEEAIQNTKEGTPRQEITKGAKKLDPTDPDQIVTNAMDDRCLQ